jgi:hypothetical protein
MNEIQGDARNCGTPPFSRSPQKEKRGTCGTEEKLIQGDVQAQPRASRMDPESPKSALSNNKMEVSMKKITLCALFVILALSMALLVSCSAPVTPSSALSAYFTALKSKDGEKAWALLSLSSKKQFDTVIFAKLKADLNKLPAETRKTFTVPGTGLNAEKVLEMSAESFFCTSIKNGPVNKQLAALDPKKMPVEKETVSGDTAKVVLKNKEEFTLVREDGAWKVDLEK